MNKLLYTKAECEFYETALGFTYCKGIEQYNNATLRNKVVCKVPLAKVLCKQYYLSDEMLDSYSDFLMMVLTGLVQLEKVPGYLQELYKHDVKFRRYLASLYYAKYSTASGDPTYLGLMAYELMNNYRKEVDLFHKTTKGSYSTLYDNCTGIDLYFAVDESLPQTILVDSKYKVEVVSNAKNWVGRIQVSD